MIKIKYINNFLLLGFFMFFTQEVKSQGKHTFLVLDKIDPRLEKLLIAEDLEIKNTFKGYDAVVFFDRKDSIFEIMYMGRDNFYNFIIDNYKIVLGVILENNLIAVTQGFKDDFLLKEGPNNISASISVKIKKIKSKGLLWFPAPTEYYSSRYKLLDTGFVFMDRNFTPY